jgi:Flp pilus assembly secretin CpaC
LTDGPAAVAKQKSDKPRVIRNFVPILRYLPNADRILEQCRKASGIEVLGSATHIVAEGQQATWQNGVEIPVPEIVPASGKSEQTTRTGFRLVGTNLSFKPETIGDGMIHLESGFEFSTLADDSQIVQVGGSSVPGINSRNLGTKLKLNPGGPVFIGLPQDDGTLIVVAVTATLVE